MNCPNGHAVCERCHNKPAIELTRKICKKQKSTNPIDIFNSILESENITMLGCHHAFIVAGAFMTAIKNTGKINITDNQIDEIFSRISNQAISGYCGLTGMCGIAPAIGACFSVMLGAKCGSDKEQKITMDVVAEICNEIANLTGPSCCKAYSWSAIKIASQAVDEEMDIHLEMTDTNVKCIYSEKHPHGCRRQKCKYFN